MFRLATAYFILINIITFITFWSDKKLARRKKSRVPESILILLSVLGGAAGGLAAMYLFRHKTQKAKFFLTLPMLLVLHVMIVAFVIIRRFPEFL